MIIIVTGTTVIEITMWIKKIAACITIRAKVSNNKTWIT